MRGPQAEAATPAPAAASEYPPSIPKVLAEEWGEGAGVGLGAPKLSPPPASKSAPGPEAFEPPSQAAVPAVAAKAPPRAGADEWVEQAAPGLDAPKLARKPGKPAARRAPANPDAFAPPPVEPATPAPDAPAPNPLREALKRKLSRSKSAIPAEDRSTVEALLNVLSTVRKGAPGLQHYPVEPPVAFKQYLANLPKPTSGSAAQAEKALKALTTGGRKSDKVGELIYRARAAGASDEAIAQAVGVGPPRQIAPRVPTSDEDLKTLLRQSVSGGRVTR